jgi:hypothetical protein
MTTPLTYDVHAAAERIGPAVTVDWLRKHAQRGEIPHTRSGRGRGRSGRIAFTDAHLAEIIAQLEQRPAGSPAPAGPGEFRSIASRGRRTA